MNVETGGGGGMSGNMVQFEPKWGKHGAIPGLGLRIIICENFKKY